MLLPNGPSNVKEPCEMLGNGLCRKLWRWEDAVKKHNADVDELNETIRQLRGELREKNRVLADEPWLEAGFSRAS